MIESSPSPEPFLVSSENSWRSPSERRRRGKAIRLWAAIVLAVVAIGVGAVYAFNQYRTFRDCSSGSTVVCRT